MDCCTIRGRSTADRPQPNQMTAQKPPFVVERSDEEILHRTRAGRTLRNRKYRRLVEDQRQNKRLFTPEIKRFLKSWLLRRRQNPYPNRSEKKDLALKTGLTYVQVCNWFANWRRKLKKSSRERHRCTWGNLIKDYNTKAQGNVEQFSISSDDSIWDEAAVNNNDLSDVDQLNDTNPDSSNADHCYFSVHNCHKLDPNNKCSTHASTLNPTYNGLDRNGNRLDRKRLKASFHSDGADVFSRQNGGGGGDIVKKNKKKKSDPPLLLSKWLESAAKFVPRDSFIAWSSRGGSWKDAAKRIQGSSGKDLHPGPGGRHRKELDAAEALTSLSRQSCVTTAP